MGGKGGKAGSWGLQSAGITALGAPELHWLRDRQGGWSLKVRGRARGSPALSLHLRLAVHPAHARASAHAPWAEATSASRVRVLTILLLLNINRCLNVPGKGWRQGG